MFIKKHKAKTNCCGNIKRLNTKKLSEKIVAFYENSSQVKNDTITWIVGST